MNNMNIYPDPKSCPPDVVGMFENYINRGIIPGDFGMALLKNDLMESFKTADDKNREAMPHIVAWLYWNMPSNLWKTEANINNHLQRMRLKMNKIKAAAILLSKPMLEFQDEE